MNYEMNQSAIRFVEKKEADTSLALNITGNGMFCCNGFLFFIKAA
jgi:hypothetical protein